MGAHWVLLQRTLRMTRKNPQGQRWLLLYPASEGSKGYLQKNEAINEENDKLLDKCIIIAKNVGGI